MLLQCLLFYQKHYACSWAYKNFLFTNWSFILIWKILQWFSIHKHTHRYCWKLLHVPIKDKIKYVCCIYNTFYAHFLGWMLFATDGVYILHCMYRIDCIQRCTEIKWYRRDLRSEWMTRIYTFYSIVLAYIEHVKHGLECFGIKCRIFF